MCSDGYVNQFNGKNYFIRQTYITILCCIAFICIILDSINISINLKNHIMKVIIEGSIRKKYCGINYKFKIWIIKIQGAIHIVIVLKTEEEA